jgi:hypothetical protein
MALAPSQLAVVVGFSPTAVAYVNRQLAAVIFLFPYGERPGGN